MAVNHVGNAKLYSGTVLGGLCISLIRHQDFHYLHVVLIHLLL